MSTRLSRLLWLAAVLPACEPSTKVDKTRRAPGENFTQAETVRIVSPANGDIVQSPLEVEVESGADVDNLVLKANGTVVSETRIDEGGNTTLVIRLPDAETTLRVEGFDADGNALTHHAVTVRVDNTNADPWVMVTSPADGSMVANPVAFTVQAASMVDHVELYADDWPLGTLVPGEVLTYSFTGTGYPRHIEAVAFDGDEEVARNDLTITVLDGTTPDESDVNSIILSTLAEYPTDGSYTYWWPDDSYGWSGNPNDIYYEGDLFSAGDSRHRSYCVGMTFEVFMRTFDVLDEDYGLGGSLNGVSFDELYDFRTDWYVRELYGMGIVDAMVNYGIGERVTHWDDVRPGDILQFWRHSGSGHNAIFIGWETDTAGQIIGFTYWSTQSSTDGVGYNDEYFGSSGSRVDPNFFFVGRVSNPENWLPWR